MTGLTPEWEPTEEQIARAAEHIGGPELINICNEQKRRENMARAALLAAVGPEVDALRAQFAAALARAERAERERDQVRRSYCHEVAARGIYAATEVAACEWGAAEAERLFPREERP